MSTDRPWGKRARSRAALIDAAFELFRDQGIARTSLDQVASRAGMTKGAVYSSFSSKEELVAAAMGRHSLALEPKLAPGMTTDEVYRALGEAAVDLMGVAGERAALIAEFHHYATTHEGLRAAISRFYAEAFDRALEIARALDPDDAAARRRVLAIQALLLGLVQQRTLTPELVSDEDVRAVFASLAN